MKNANENTMAINEVSINSNEEKIIELSPFKDYEILTGNSLKGKIKKGFLRKHSKGSTNIPNSLFIKYPEELIHFYMGLYHDGVLNYNECLISGKTLIKKLVSVRDNVRQDLIDIMVKLNLSSLKTEDTYFNLKIRAILEDDETKYAFKNNMCNFLIDHMGTHLSSTMKKLINNYKCSLIKSFVEYTGNSKQEEDYSHLDEYTYILDNHGVYCYFDKYNNLNGLITSKLMFHLIGKYCDVKEYLAMVEAYNKIVSDIVKYSLNESHINDNIDVMNKICLDGKVTTSIIINNQLNKIPVEKRPVLDYDYLYESKKWSWCTIN